MKYFFKTSYGSDIDLIQHRGQAFWYGLLLLCAVVAPWGLGTYWLSQLTFILIYSIAGIGLMILSGYTGLLSAGHAAFLGVGAYTQAILIAAGWPFPVCIAAAGALSAIVGIIVGLPALRVRGFYLAIATLAFGFIVEEILTRWESVTGGNLGLMVKSPVFLGINLGTTSAFYWTSLTICVLMTFVLINLLRSATGRAFIAIRDSEISAQSMGINLARYKTISFAFSAAAVGIAGALYAHQIRFLSPEQFSLIQSIDLIMLVVIGGLASIHGIFFGAIFLIVAPQLIGLLRLWLPDTIGQAPGLQAVIYGLTLVLIVMFEPGGIYARWVRVRTYFQHFPLYRKGMMRRQRAFQKSERVH